MPTLKFFVVFVVFLASPLLAQPSNGPYVQLIPGASLPPPVGPDLSAKAAYVGLAYNLIAKAGPWYNEKKVKDELQKNFEDAFTNGLKRADTLGQKGVLLKVQVLQEQVPAGTLYSLRGSGATVVGVGPDADSICYAQECYVALETAMRPGQTVTSDSGYVFIERSGKVFEVKKYSINILDAKAKQMRFDKELRNIYNESIRAKAMDGYAEQLIKVAKDQSDRKAIQSLLQNRDDALKQIRNVEKELAAELNRQKSIAAANATLKSISNALSLGSAIAMASATLGTDVTAGQPNGINSIPQLQSILGAMGVDSATKIQSINIQHKTIQNQLTGTETQILTVGVSHDMKPDTFDVLSPKP
ncbi:hypothetical protein [Cupriavidus pinatubonensis]|uniref:hypothetical protein n=1 Tax=Cupriavidus pinatubonensis TaxID=248026 RepID=UPI001129977F|nr:hypothetical protein [Cupriavidus pinatubonensis]TPQ26384.1 hypothetical protein C2U69_34900 [Cupriavidus pinatubonensis]